MFYRVFYSVPSYFADIVLNSMFLSYLEYRKENGKEGWSDMAKDRVNRTRKNELKIYLSDNEKYILDRKVELSKRKSAADYIRTLILFGFVYDVDYSYLRQYNETLGKISGNLNQIEKRISSTGNVYGEEMAEVKAIMDEVWKTQKAMLKKQPLIHNK